jgi:hypothetical protein
MIITQKKIVVIDPINKYIETNKSKLLSSFDRSNMNNNIQDVFYNKKDLNETLLDKNNVLEKIWKTRILFENTPRGNIIMHYDVYKQGFAYYSDMNGIPYNILNAVAMKYVTTYSCRDFFMDNEYIDELKQSPLIKLYLEEEKVEKPKSTDKEKEKMPKMDSSAFAKLKNYRITENNENEKSTSEKVNKKPDKEYNRNIFINLGRVSNFQFLQKPVKKNKLNGFYSKLLDGVNGECELQEQISYSKYKELLLKKKENSG